MTKNLGLFARLAFALSAAAPLIRDLNGRLVRGGIVKVDRVPGAVSTIRGSDANFTNRVGKARLVAAVSKKQLGTRVLLRISARTPKARALQLRSVYLPG